MKNEKEVNLLNEYVQASRANTEPRSLKLVLLKHIATSFKLIA